MRDLWMFSPLTPALSPLRGEGVTVGIRERLPSAEPPVQGTVSRSEVTVPTPSPLNGERAGVRGEAVRLPSEFMGTANVRRENATGYFEPVARAGFRS